MSPLFQAHKLSEEGFRKVQQVSHAFDSLLEQLGLIGAPYGREMAVVRTKLEEACFFAKKALTNDPANLFDENRGFCLKGQAETCAAPDAGLGDKR